MSRVPWIICCVVCGLGIMGCRTGGQSSARNDRGLFMGDTPAKGNTSSPDPILNRDTRNNVTVGQKSGVLAGQVIDQYDRRVGNVQVRVVPITGSLNGAAAPVDYERTANEEGFFAISNLDPNQIYQLIGRIEIGGRVFTGATTARPPDPRITIRLTRVSASDSGSGRSPIKKAEAREPRREPAASMESPRPLSEDPPREPDSERRDPSGGFPSPPVPAPVVPKKDDIPLDRTIVIPPVEPRKTPTSVPARELPNPSCQRLGRLVKSFALRDVQKKPWVYPKDKQGRLLLLDFWHSRCGHCFKASPMLTRLQKDYGPHGLEVIGIACESASSPEREQRVIAALSKHPMGYRILMSGYRSPNQPCPVQVQLAVSSFPTVILLDENGTIVWRSEGLSNQKYLELRNEIYKRVRR